MPTLVVSALSTFDNKGLKKGKKEVSAFEKQIKGFGKTFAAVFSARALFNYSKNAVKAFAEDEKAAKSLELQLKNTGFAFSAPSVEYFIANLQKTTGVLDDQLRPAFQQLLTVTGSITKSQEALGVALNISAATGKSLTEVSAALTRGFSGNTAGLSRLGAGISKATLKAGDMDAILAELNEKFAGQSAARLTTYAGKMDLLKVASADASEIIGKSLVDALTALGDDNSIEGLTKQMENLATNIGTVIRGLGEVASELQKVASTPGISQLLEVLKFTSIFGSLSRAAGPAPAKELPANQQRSANRISAQVRKLEAATIKNGVNLRKAENDQLKKKTEVDKLKDKFDLERIGLNAALNAATDEETKLRIRAQLAILDNNEALAKKYNAEIEGAAAADKLSKSLNTATTFLDILASRPNPLFTAEGNKTPRGLNQIAPDSEFIVQPGTTGGSNSSTTIINVPVNAGTIVSEGELTNLIADTVRVNLKYGNKLVPAGTIQ